MGGLVGVHGLVGLRGFVGVRRFVGVPTDIRMHAFIHIHICSHKLTLQYTHIKYLHARTHTQPSKDWSTDYLWSNS